MGHDDIHASTHESGGSDEVAAFTMHAVPASVTAGIGDYQVFVIMFKDATGTPDRVVVVSITTANAIGLIEYKRLGNAWVFDPADCAKDTFMTLNFTADADTRLTAFAVDNPAGTGDRILFIAGNNDATPDTFEMDSIVLAPGSTSLTAVACVIAGANQPPDTNTMSTVSIPLSTTRAMTFFLDDAYFADISESGGTYTFTYDDAPVISVDASINVGEDRARAYSGMVIGSQVVLLVGLAEVGNTAIWEMSIAAVLTEEFNAFATGLVGSDQHNSARVNIAISAIDGVFAIAAPVGGDGDDGENCAYLITSFPLDSL